MRVDVLVLTLGREAAVRRCLASVVDQLQPDDGLLVLVNGGGLSSAARLAADVPRATVSRNPDNRGVAGGRNDLARSADAPVLLFLDDDAEAPPGLIDGVRTRFEDEPAVDLVALRIDDPTTGRPRSHEFPDRRKQLVDRSFTPTYFVGAGFAVRREVLLDAGGFDESLVYSLEELDLSLRLAEAGAVMAYDPRLRVVHHAEGVGAIGNLERVVANRWRVPVRHLPLPMAVSHIVVWTAVWLVRAARERQVRGWVRGVVSGLRGLPVAVRERRPLSRDVVRRLRADHGRLWF